MVTKEDLHRLVDELPDDDVEAAARLLRELRDPLLRSIAEATEEDEEISPEERAAIEEGLADIRAGRVISDEELQRRLGL